MVDQEEAPSRTNAANQVGNAVCEHLCTSPHVGRSAANDSYFESAINAARIRAYRAAVSAGLTQADREDLHQEILLDLLKRAAQYDPYRGSPGTYTGVVSEHRTADFLNALKRDRSHLTFFSGQEAANDETAFISAEFYEAATPIWADDGDLFSNSDSLHDLETALAYMTDEQAALFQLLEAHQDLPSAAKAWGMSSATFYRRVADLQMHLRMFGFKSAA